MNYKIILLGSQCSGKTELISYLKKTTNFICIDHDEEIKKRHNGVYPSDHEYVSNEVQPKIEDDVMKMKNVIYSASFWGLGKDRLIHDERIKLAKKKGFKFVYLKTDKRILIKRNKYRFENTKYGDASKSFVWYLSVYKGMKKKNLFDFEINTNQPVEKIANELIQFIGSQKR